MPSRKSYYEPEVHLDRTSPIPLYHQIAEPIEKAILSGVLAPGTRLEDELTMAKRLRVSRPTARRALQILGDHGLLVRRRGVGTQVAPARVHRPAELPSLFEDIIAEGKTPKTQILSYTQTPASPEVAKRLEIDTGTSVTTIKRLRFADDTPLALMTNVIRTEWAPSAQRLEEVGFYTSLAAHGIVPTMARQTIGARLATTEDLGALGEDSDTALLTMQRTAFDEAGTVVEHGDHVFRAGQYSLNLTVFAR
ncbi:MAG: GntR family transcriptional regulator [Actinomycetaceae bacterium]|nr:GntR family transcriptional regulator [Actinomycetaceae bacterium]